MFREAYNIVGTNSQSQEVPIMRAGFNDDDKPVVIIGTNEVSLDNVISTPTGGETGQILTKTATGAAWQNAPNPVEANPTLVGTEPDLTSIKIGDNKFKVAATDAVLESAKAKGGIGWVDLITGGDWDGDTTGRVSFTLVEEEGYYSVKFYQINPNIYDISYLPTGASEQTMSFKYIMSEPEEITSYESIGYSVLNRVFVVNTPGTAAGITFTQTGTYFRKNSSGYISKIVAKDATITWDGNTEGKTKAGDNLYLVSSLTPLPNDDNTITMFGLVSYEDMEVESYCNSDHSGCICSSEGIGLAIATKDNATISIEIEGEEPLIITIPNAGLYYGILDSVEMNLITKYAAIGKTHGIKSKFLTYADEYNETNGIIKWSDKNPDQTTRCGVKDGYIYYAQGTKVEANTGAAYGNTLNNIKIGDTGYNIASGEKWFTVTATVSYTSSGMSFNFDKNFSDLLNAHETYKTNIRVIMTSSSGSINNYAEIPYVGTVIGSSGVKKFIFETAIDSKESIEKMQFDRGIRFICDINEGWKTFTGNITYDYSYPVSTTLDSTLKVNTVYNLGTLSSLAFVLPECSIGNKITLMFTAGSAFTATIGGSVCGDTSIVTQTNKKYFVTLEAWVDGSTWWMTVKSC